MGIKAKAVVFPEPNKAEIREITLPEVEDDDILVKMEYSGVSVGTERWILTSTIPGLKYPLVPGYQNIGTVQEVGKKVTSFKTGDKVFLGYSRLPDGLSAGSGAHMSYGVYAQNREGIGIRQNAIKITDDFIPQEVALLTLATVGYNGANWKDVVSKGDLVVVIGQGMIGQMASQNARARGARKVITSDFFDKRVELSGKYSADIAVNSKKTDLLELVKKEDPKGADVVIESVGIGKNISEAAKLVKRFTGKLMLLGTYWGMTPVNWREIHGPRITIYTTDYYFREEQLAALKLLKEKKLKIKPLITHEFNYKEAPKIYEMMLNDPSEMLGVVIDWRE